MDPAAIVTDGVAVTRLLLVVTSTLAPPAGAFLFSVTVHAPVADGEKTVGQTSEEIAAGVARAMVKLAEEL